MLVPVYVNTEIVDEKGKANIVAAVLDLHPSKINKIMNTYDGYTSIIDNYGMVHKILVPFIFIYNLYNQHHAIDDTFKEEVDTYLLDNWKALKERLNNNTNGGETDYTKF